MLDLNQLKNSMPKDSWHEVKEKLYRHTRGVGMDTYLRKQRPSEPNDVLKWRIDTLNKLTKDVFRRGLNNATRMLLETPLLLDCNEEVRAYVENDNFYSHSGWVNMYSKLVDYFQYIIEDPNGLLAVIPISEGKEELSPQLTPTNERLGFKLDYIPSENLVFYSADVAIYYWDGHLFYDDTENIWELFPISGGYRFELWYNHNAGHKLSSHLGGYKSSDKNNKPYFDSFFDGAVEFADGFVNQYENLRAEMLRNSFPISEFREMPCNVCNGKKHVTLDDGTVEDCKNCNATGKLIHYNTNTAFIRPKKSSLTDLDTGVSQDPLVSYYAPPMTGTELNYKFSFDLYNRAGEAIGATVTKMAQSGVAKEEDKESYYSMLAQIMQNTIRLYQFSVSCIQVIWANDIETPIKITPSKDIRLNSQSYILDLVKTYREAGVPPEMVADQLSQLVKRNTSIDEAKIIKLMPRVNVLYGKPMQDIVMLKSMAGSPVNDYTLFVNLNAYRIFKMIDLKDKDNQEIIAEFDRVARIEFENYKPSVNEHINFI
jgi:hypothetical protein